MAAEGVVYKDFNQNKHYVDDIDYSQITRYYAGVDWGYEHPGSIVVMGETEDGTTYLIEEHTNRHQEVEFWVEVAHDIIARYGKMKFWCDSARPEHIKRFKREKIKAYNANKEVLSGIESVARLMKQNKFYVLEPNVKRFKDEVFMYVWNERTGDPVKEWDDVLDAVRYAVFSEKAKAKLGASGRI